MTRDKLTKIIEKSQSRTDSSARDYIGASIIGSDCWRQMWYEFNGYLGEDVPAKTRRTWAIGKHLECLILDWLENAGLQLDREYANLKSKSLDIFKGHVDSVWIKKDGSKVIIEIKTAKDASFTIFVKKGLKLWNPQYYAQIQSYMGMSGIHSTYILVLNKDNSELSDELVLFDEEFYKKLEAKALMISTAPTIPPKVNNSPLWYQCKCCKYNKICHNSSAVD